MLAVAVPPVNWSLIHTASARVPGRAVFRHFVCGW